MTDEIQTERLTLRPPQASDAPRIAQLMSVKDIPWNLGRAPWPYGLRDAEMWIEAAIRSHASKTEYPFVLIHSQHGLIGSSGMMVLTDEIFELGYWIGEPYWGQGYVTEAARAVLAWSEEVHGVRQFVSGHINDNPASGRVLEKLGFTPVGEVTHYVVARDCDVSATRYVLGAPADLAIKSAAHFTRPS